jgi:hypothetical protein
MSVFDGAQIRTGVHTAARFVTEQLASIAGLTATLEMRIIALL